MPQSALDRLANVSDQSGKPPVRTLALPPIPGRVAKAYPEMDEWRKQANRELSEWVKALNVGGQTT